MLNDENQAFEKAFNLIPSMLNELVGEHQQGQQESERKVKGNSGFSLFSELQ